MTDLLVWTIILVSVDVLYFFYERNELNPKKALNSDVAQMSKARKRNRMFFIGLNIFVLGIWVKDIKEKAGLLMMLTGSFMVFLGRNR